MTSFAIHRTLPAAVLIMSHLHLIKSATALLEDNFLLVADRQTGNIYQVDLSTGDSNGLLATSSSAEPTAVAFDPTARDIYWIDAASRTINKYSLPTGSTRTIYQFQLDSRNTTTIYRIPTGNLSMSWLLHDGAPVIQSESYALTVDPSRQKLYYTDADNGIVGEMSFDGSNRQVLHSNRSSQPSSIAVDTVNGTVYWTDSSRGIFSNFGTARRTIIPTEFAYIPCALAIDSRDRIMYWADCYRHTIERSNLDGSGRTTVVHSSAMSSAMAVDSNFLYYTDFNLFSGRSQIKKLDRVSQTSTVVSSPSVLSHQPSALVVVRSNTTTGSSFAETVTSTSISTSRFPIPTWRPSFRMTWTPWFPTADPDTDRTANPDSQYGRQHATSSVTTVVAVAIVVGVVIIVIAVVAAIVVIIFCRYRTRAVRRPAPMPISIAPAAVPVDNPHQSSVAAVSNFYQSAMYRNDSPPPPYEEHGPTEHSKDDKQ